MRTLLPMILLAAASPLHAEIRSCHSEWQDGEVDYEVNVRVRLDRQEPAGFVIETFVSWDQDDQGNRQLFSAYVDSDSRIDETFAVSDDHGTRRFRLHPDGNDAEDATVVGVRPQRGELVVDVERVSRYHRGMAPFPRHAVIGAEGTDCRVLMFEP